MIEREDDEPQCLNTFERSNNWANIMLDELGGVAKPAPGVLPPSLFIFRQVFENDEQIQWYRTDVTEVDCRAFQRSAAVKLQYLGLYIGNELLLMTTPMMFLLPDYQKDFKECKWSLQDLKIALPNLGNQLYSLMANKSKTETLTAYEQQFIDNDIWGAMISLTACSLSIKETEEHNYIASMELRGSVSFKQGDRESSYPLCVMEVELFVN